MIDNAVLRLRAERLARATRPFLARGNRIRRCQRCLPPQTVSVRNAGASAGRQPLLLVMFDTEVMKPSNTGRLIADILPNTEAFRWSRTEAAAGAARSGRQPRLSAHGRLSGLAGAERGAQAPRRRVSRRCLLCSTHPDGSAENVSQARISMRCR